jgi:hypothetical protein
MNIWPNTSKLATAVFSAGLVLRTTVLITAGGNSPTLTIDFRLGCSVVNRAVGGLFLQ